jgi:gliding motility-associated-like protein
MKNNILLLTFLLFAGLSFSQTPTLKNVITVDSKEYQDAKMAGTLDQYTVKNAVSGTFSPSLPGQFDLRKKKIKGGIPPKASGCNCYVDPDSTYLLALAPNDDGFSAAITIPFSFCFYGDTVTTMYINNNGNITFGSGLSAFSSTAFPSANNQIIAPFWADVDTRNGNGQVLYKVTPTAIYINWKDVGYYSQQGDKLNSFQLIISDGLDPVIDGGNVAFCYEDMQWTTGSASQGVNGFGGIPATAGANKGNNINYFLIARFDHPGTDFDGALGNPDGISWLDNKSFFFDICNFINIPPVPNGASSCDTFRVCSIGDTADVQFIFLSPEATQSTSITISAPTLPNLQVVTNAPGNTAYTVLRVPGTAATVGTHTVVITATDNFTPAGVTQLNLTVIIDSTGTSNFNPSLSPLSGCDSILVDVLGGGYDSYLWDNLLLDSAVYVSSALQNFGVTVEKNGCFKRVSANFLVAPSFTVNLLGNNMLCSAVPTSLYQLPDSLNYGSVTWGLTNPGLDSLYSNNFGPGSYTVNVTDTLGVCSESASFNITQLPPLSVSPDTAVCANTYTVNASGGSGSGSWSSVGTPIPSGMIPTTGGNTLLTFSTTGVYTLVYTDATCNESDTVVLTISKPITSLFSASNPFYCPGTPGSLYTVANSTRYQTITWGNNPNLDGIASHILPAGVYTCTVTDTLGLCSASILFNVTTQPDIVLMPDITICTDTLTMVSNTGGGAPNSGTWSVLPGSQSPIFQNLNNLNQLLTFPTYGVYSIAYTASNCPDKDTLVVTYAAPSPLNFNNPDFFVCPGTSEFIALVDSAIFTSVSWGLADPILDAMYSANLPVGAYTVSVVDINGCPNDSAFSIVSQPPVVLTPHPFTCGDSLGLDGNAGNDGGLWTKLSGPGTATFFPATSIQTSVKWSKPGVYTIIYTEPVCQDADTIVIDVTFYPYSEVGNELGCIGVSQTLFAYSIWENVTSYVWSDGQTGSSATFSEPGYYYLESTNSCGTHIWDFYYDARVCDIEMPNVFTPNGDLVNGFFGPINTDGSGFASFNMKLFNRWGNLMYETSDITKGWNGISPEGQPAGDGVYFYVVTAKDVEGKDLNKQGFFHLVAQ